MIGSIEAWEAVEPSRDGIERIVRMRSVRDDIADRARRLVADLAHGPRDT